MALSVISKENEGDQAVWELKERHEQDRKCMHNIIILECLLPFVSLS